MRATVAVRMVGLCVAVAAVVRGGEVVFDDPLGACATVNAPVGTMVSVSPELRKAAAVSRLYLREAGKPDTLTAAQLEAGATDAAMARLWWLQPEGSAGVRQFELVIGEPGTGRMRVVSGDGSGDGPVPLPAGLEGCTAYELLLEDDKPVLAYQTGLVAPPAGVTGKYAVARTDYVHPLYGSKGEVLTTDFSKDHPHHRGIYWAWPEVAYRGAVHDLHALQGVFARDVKVLRRQAGPVFAQVEAECVWKWDGTTPIVHEQIAIRAYREVQGRRAVDFILTFTGLVDGVTIARRESVNYGGFNCRFSAMADQEVIAHTATAENGAIEHWGALVGVPPGNAQPVAMVILEALANPEYPGRWISYPNLNWLQPTFPADRQHRSLPPGRPLSLSYRIWINDGAVDAAGLARLAAAYQVLPTAEFAEIGMHRMGGSRRELLAVEERLATADNDGKMTLARQLSALLADGAATVEARDWACRQLGTVGNQQSLADLVAALPEPALSDAVCRALRAIPGPGVDEAIRKALPTVPDAVVSRVVNLIGERRDPQAVAVLTPLVGNADPAVAEAAVYALGAIGTVDAATVLERQLATGAPTVITALLACAGHLEATEPGRSAGLYQKLLELPAAGAASAAALLGLARTDGRRAIPFVAAALKDQDLHRQQTAAAAIGQMPPGDADRWLQELGGLPPPVQAGLIRTLTAKGERSILAPAIRLAGADDSAVQLAAVDAMTALGDVEVVEPLARLAAGTDQLAERARRGLCRLRDPAVGPRLQRLAGSGDPVMVVALIDCLRERHDPGTPAVLLGLAASLDEPVAKAAVTALATAAGAEELPALLALFLSSEGSAQVRIGRSITTVCSRDADPDACVAILLKNCPEGKQRSSVLDLLPSIGSDAALAVLEQQLTVALAAAGTVDSEAAIRAVCKWSDRRVLPLLEKIVGRAADGHLRLLAVQAAIRLLADADAATRKTALTQLLAVAQDDAERAMITQVLQRDQVVPTGAVTQ